MEILTKTERATWRETATRLIKSINNHQNAQDLEGRLMLFSEEQDIKHALRILLDYIDNESVNDVQTEYQVVSQDKPISHGRYPVTLKGSGTTAWRTIYSFNGRFYMKWYGQNVLVEKTDFGFWRTVENY